MKMLICKQRCSVRTWRKFVYGTTWTQASLKTMEWINSYGFARSEPNTVSNGALHITTMKKSLFYCCCLL
jgi:hypothetical protein